MSNTPSDESVLDRIKGLVTEEQALYAEKPMDDQSIARVNALKIELDQCWDLLRQRRALEEFGDDPNRAKVRPASVVEKYEQ